MAKEKPCNVRTVKLNKSQSCILLIRIIQSGREAGGDHVTPYQVL